MYLFICIRMYVCMYIYIYTYTLYMYVCMYIYIYIHIHIAYVDTYDVYVWLLLSLPSCAECIRITRGY